jgi:WD40 repeat protein
MRKTLESQSLSGSAGRTRRSGLKISLFVLVAVLVQPCSSPGQDVASQVKLTETARATLVPVPPVEGQFNSVSALGYAPDGSTLAVGMRKPNLVLLLDSATLVEQGRLDGHLALVSRVVFSPDGKALVSAGHDGTVRIWDIATKRQRLLLDQFQGNVRGLAISPDGKRIFTGETSRGLKGTAQVWDAQDGRLLGSLSNYDHSIEYVSVSPDGQTLATCSRDQTVRLWDLATYKQKNIFDAKGPFANELAFLPDGKNLAAVFDDKTIRLFDVATLRQKYQIVTTAQSFLYLAVSPDGSILATADTNRLQLWRSSDGSPLASVPDTGGRIAAIRFSPDGRSVAVGGPSGFLSVFRLDFENK